MKLSIAVALSHDAKLLILDEATSGLDPVVRDEILDIFLDYIQNEDCSILIASHITSDLEKVADYITFVNNGKIIFSENKDEEQIDEEILKQSKMKGLLAKDAHIIKKMDKALYEEDVKNSLIVPAGLNKDGSLSKSTNSVTYQEFEILRKYVKHEIKDLCEGMLGGDISINPNKHKDRTSCDFCIYNAICQFDSTLKDNNYNIIKDKKNEEIIRMMAEEVE